MNEFILDSLLIHYMFFFSFQTTKIHASIRRKYIYKFEKELFEGDVYLMSKFSVVANMGEYRSTRHFFKLNFQLGTKATKGVSGLVPDSVFTFIHLADFLGKIFQTDYLIGQYFFLHYH